jgi:hypothetical protein
VRDNPLTLHIGRSPGGARPDALVSIDECVGDDEGAEHDSSCSGKADHGAVVLPVVAYFVCSNATGRAGQDADDQVWEKVIPAWCLTHATGAEHSATGWSRRRDAGRRGVVNAAQVALRRSAATVRRSPRVRLHARTDHLRPPS